MTNYNDRGDKSYGESQPPREPQDTSSGEYYVVDSLEYGGFRVVSGPHGFFEAACECGAVRRNEESSEMSVDQVVLQGPASADRIRELIESGETVEFAEEVDDDASIREVVEA